MESQEQKAAHFERLKRIKEVEMPEWPEEDIRLLNARKNLIRKSGVITGEQLLKYNIDEIPKLVNPIIQKVGLIALAGSSDTGKSSFLRQLVTAICTGEDKFIGFPIDATYRSCIYVSTEDDEDSMAVLIRKQNKVKKNDPNNYRNLRYIFDSTNLIKKLSGELEKKPADIIVIDAYSDIFTGEINQTNKVRSFLEEYSNLAKKHRCVIIFLHHTSKNAEDKTPSKNNLLGSQGFEAKMRMVMELRKDLNNPELRHLCIVKGNYLGMEYKKDSFELKFSKEMLFESTSRRIPFGDLIKKDDKDSERIKLVGKVMELKAENLSLRKIAEQIGTSKNTVDRILRKK